MRVKDETPDWVSNKTHTKRSIIVAVGYACLLTKKGDTREDDKFRVLLEGKIVRRGLARKDFFNFLQGVLPNLRYEPVVVDY